MWEDVRGSQNTGIRGGRGEQRRKRGKDATPPYTNRHKTKKKKLLQPQQ